MDPAYSACRFLDSEPLPSRVWGRHEGALSFPFSFLDREYRILLVRFGVDNECSRDLLVLSEQTDPDADGHSRPVVPLGVLL